MIPPIFAVCSADVAVGAQLGSNPVRLFPFGHAPEGVAKPYAVWQLVSGAPENYLTNVPDLDSYTTQVDVYADTAASARAVAIALRDAIEPVAHLTRWGGESRDSETLNYRVSFDAEWKVSRVDAPVILGGSIVINTI